MRAAIKKQLESVCNEKSAINYEKRLWAYCEKKELNYHDVAYEFVGRMMHTSSKDERVALMKDLENGKSDWDTIPFNKYKKKVAVINNEELYPDSEFQCRNPRCKSMKCYTESHQTRAGDEGMTNYVICSVCARRYRLN